MAGASGWHVQATIWVVGGYARQLWAVLANCITTILDPTFEFGNSNMKLQLESFKRAPTALKQGERLG